MKKILVCFLSVMALICMTAMTASADVIHVAMMDDSYLEQIKSEYDAKIEEQKQAAAKATQKAKKETSNQTEAKVEALEAAAHNVGAGKYSSADIQLLYKICHAESRGEGQRGQMAVANVVLNRVKSSKFPNSIRGVIYQSGQFTPAASKSFSSIVPSQQVVASVNKVIAGERVFGDNVLYFKSAKSSAKWRKLKVSTQIGRHVFYAG